MQYDNRCRMGIMVTGFAQKLVQVFVNLLSNATDACERGSNFRLLADSILARTAQRSHRKIMFFDEQAYTQMFHYQWSGNVREPENVIERAVILRQQGNIEASNLALNNLATGHQLPLYELENRLSLGDHIVSFVKKYQPRYNETQLAGMLGISRKNLWEKRQRLQIPSRKQ